MEIEEISGIRKRLSILAIIVLSLFAVLLFRLWELQIAQKEKYRTLSENNRIRVLPIKSPRGYIKDRHGALLVDNRPVFKLYMIPEEVPNIESLLSQIGGNINVDMEALKKRLKSHHKFKPVLVKGDLSRNELAYLEEHRPDLSGTFIPVEPVRFYRYGPLASHLLGYLGEVNDDELRNSSGKNYMAGDYKGKLGLEKAYEDVLRGHKGRKFVEVNARGRELRSLGDVEPRIGNNIILTIDLELQLLAEDLLGSERGAIVALDPTNGQVLAYVSKPSFDPNLFASGMRKQDWMALKKDEGHPLQDRVLDGQYPPGSVFKIITAVAALEEGVINEGDTYYCPGYYYFGGRAYRDWKKGGHGVVNIHRALVESCDVFFYQVGNKLGIDLINKYARGFGLGKTIGTILGREKPGLIPSTAWKRASLNKPWYPGETLSAAIGQGYVMVTPLQMAVVISSIANGGTIYLPQFVLHIEDADGRITRSFRPQALGSIPATPKTLKIVRKALWGVVNEPHGTGYKARIPWADVAGKTGTAQVIALGKIDGKEKDAIPKKHLDHAWFVSFAPFDNPVIAIALLVENAGRGGGSYAYIAKKLIENYLGREKNLGLN